MAPFGILGLLLPTPQVASRVKSREVEAVSQTDPEEDQVDGIAVVELAETRIAQDP